VRGEFTSALRTGWRTHRGLAAPSSLDHVGGGHPESGGCLSWWLWSERTGEGSDFRMVGASSRSSVHQLKWYLNGNWPAQAFRHARGPIYPA
jgi:hypothetical protein